MRSWTAESRRIFRGINAGRRWSKLTIAGPPAEGTSPKVDVDQELVAEAARGSREAFDDLIRRHQVSIVSLARALTGGSADAEDIAQEVFLRAWRSLGGFRGDSTFRTWLHRVAINVIHSHHGRVSRWQRLLRVSPPATPDAPDDPIERAPDSIDVEADVVLRDAIDKALSSLPEELRVAVTLRDVQGLDYREIARVLDVPIGTVESRIFRGRQRLKPLLEPLRSRAGGSLF